MRVPSLPNPYDLNRCDQETMRRVRNVMEPWLQNLAEAVDYRILKFPQRFAREGQHYLENAAILLLSRMCGKESFFKCSLLQHTCKKWKVCPYCAHLKRMEILQKFLPVFNNDVGSWGFFTLSFSRCNYCGDCYFDNLEMIWDACRFAFEAMVDLGEFEAVFLVEEFQVLSYYPVPKVLAHVHAVVLSEEISLEKTERLKGFVNIYPGWVKVPQKWITQRALRNRIEDDLVDPKLRWMHLHDCSGVGMEPSTRTFQIKAEGDFAGILGYLVKPIDWSVKYIEEWQRYCVSDPEVGPLFNGNTDRVIDCWQFFSMGRYQHVYLGKAHPRRTGFVGIPKAQRLTKSHQRRVRIKLEDCNEERLFAPGDLGEPLELSGQ